MIQIEDLPDYYKYYFRPSVYGESVFSVIMYEQLVEDNYSGFKYFITQIYYVKDIFDYKLCNIHDSFEENESRISIFPKDKN